MAVTECDPEGRYIVLENRHGNKVNRPHELFLTHVILGLVNIPTRLSRFFDSEEWESDTALHSSSGVRNRDAEIMSLSMYDCCATTLTEPGKA